MLSLFLPQGQTGSRAPSLGKVMVRGQTMAWGLAERRADRSPRRWSDGVVGDLTHVFRIERKGHAPVIHGWAPVLAAAAFVNPIAMLPGIIGGLLMRRWWQVPFVVAVPVPIALAWAADGTAGWTFVPFLMLATVVWATTAFAARRAWTADG